MAIPIPQRKAVAKYNAKAYDEIKIRVPKGEKNHIKAYATKNGESVNKFINRLIKEAMGNKSKKG